MVDAHQISKRVAGEDVLRDVTFSAASFECVRLAGQERSGRTTLLRILATLVRPSAGAISIDGIDAIRDPMSARRSLLYVGRDTPTLPAATVDEYLWVIATARGARYGRRARARAADAGVDLRTPHDRLPTADRAAVLLLAAAIVRPKVLLLDARHLMPSDRLIGAAAGAVRELRESGCTIIMAADRSSPLAVLCGRVVDLRDEQHGEPEAARPWAREDASWVR
jgi:ABC-type multidrug transport system ATPase subunit